MGTNGVANFVHHEVHIACKKKPLSVETYDVLGTANKCRAVKYAPSVYRETVISEQCFCTSQGTDFVVPQYSFNSLQWCRSVCVVTFHKS